MNDYLQPDFYRFNRDSLELVKWVIPQVNQCESLLDLGAGCGVIGLELAQKIHPRKLVLLEGQEEFKPFITSNLCFAPPETRCEVVFQNFSDWSSKEKFNVMVCNPPYYLPGRGEPSSDSRRGIARSFIKDGWKDLLIIIERGLAPGGEAYLVVKNQLEIINEIQMRLKESLLKARFEQVGDLVFVKLF